VQVNIDEVGRCNEAAANVTSSCCMQKPIVVTWLCWQQRTRQWNALLIVKLAAETSQQVMGVTIF